MRRAGPVLLALVGFTALTVFVFGVAPAELWDTLPARRDRVGDSALLMWAMSHVSTTLFTDPLHLFDANIHHPLPGMLACTDHMIGQALLGLPIWLTTHNAVLEYNLLSLLSYVVGGTAVFMYARALLGVGPAAAFAGGIAFVFTPQRFSSFLWLQVLWTAFVPLALLCWLRFVERLRWRDWLAWIVCWLMHSLMGMYLTLYFAVIMGVLALLPLLAGPTRRERRLWVGTIAAPLVVGVLLLPTFVPYVHLRVTQGTAPLQGLDTYLSFLLPGTGTLTGELLGLAGRARMGQFGPGLVVGALFAVGVVSGARRESASGLSPRFLWTVHVVGLCTTAALMFTPMELQQRLPAFELIRNTNRVFLLGIFFVAVFVAQGVARLEAWARSRRAALVVGACAVVLLAADMGEPPRERTRLPVGDAMPAAIDWLRDQPEGTVVYEPVLGPDPLARAMYRSIRHRKPMPTGYGGFTPPIGRYANYVLITFPSANALRLLDRLGVTHVRKLFPSTQAVEAFMETPAARTLRIAARFGPDVVFDVRGAYRPPAIAAAVTVLDRTRWHAESNAGEAMGHFLRDGDPHTVWTGVPPRRGAPYVVLALRGARRVAGIRCLVRRNGADGMIISRVEVSRDGKSWTPTGVGFEPVDFERYVFHPPELIEFESRFPTTTARFVRLYNPGLKMRRVPWEMAELDVLIDEDERPGRRPTDDRAQRSSSR